MPANMLTSGCGAGLGRCFEGATQLRSRKMSSIWSAGSWSIEALSDEASAVGHSPGAKGNRMSRASTMASWSDLALPSVELEPEAPWSEVPRQLRPSLDLSQVVCMEPTELLGFCSMTDLARLRTAAPLFGGRGDGLLDARVMCQLREAFLTRLGLSGRSMHEAAEEGDLDAVVAYLSTGASPDACDSHGFVPLHYAADGKHSAVLRRLLKAGANADARHRGLNIRAGWTPLHFAANAGARDCVFLLLWEGKADVNAMDNCRRTPLFYALDRDRKKCTSLLWKFGGRADLHFIEDKNLAEAQRVDDWPSLGDDRRNIDAWGGHASSSNSGESAASDLGETAAATPYLHPYVGPAGDVGPSLTIAAAMMPEFEW